MDDVTVSKPTCYAHEFGRLALSRLLEAKVDANEAQDKQAEAVLSFYEMPKPLIISTMRKVARTDSLTRYIVGRCVASMPDMPVDPLTIMAARLLCETEDDAMVVCAMIFAMSLDAPGGLLDITRYADETKGYVFDRATLNWLISEQKTLLIPDGLDENRLNSLHNYNVTVEV